MDRARRLNPQRRFRFAGLFRRIGRPAHHIVNKQAKQLRPPAHPRLAVNRIGLRLDRAFGCLAQPGDLHRRERLLLRTQLLRVLDRLGEELAEHAQAVQRQGEAIDLTGTEFDLLLLLARAPGKVFSRDDILNQLRGHEAELYTRAVDIVVSRLRKKLEPLDCIKTLRNAGYTLALAPRSAAA